MTQRHFGNRAEFVTLTKKILAESSPSFDFTRIGSTGVERGLLTRAEAEVLALHGSFPTWLAEGISSAVTVWEPAATILTNGYTASLSAAAATNNPAAPQVKGLVPTSVAVPPVHKIQVNVRARHYVHNFRKLTWGRSGICSRMSDKNGLVLHPFLEDVAPVQLSGHSLMAVVEGSVVYTHWLLDTFPRLLALAEARTALADFDNIVLATTAHGFHRQMLARLGVDHRHVVTRQKEGPYFETESFTYVSAPRSRFAAHPRTYEMVCEHFGQPRAPKGQTRRLFVSRAGAGRRRIVNESALIEVLEPLGFQVIRFEDYEMEEMAAMMAQASHVISPHGAGLANLVFCRPGAKVMEIFSAHASSEYRIIAQQKGLTYHIFQANGPNGLSVKGDEAKELPFFERNGLDIEVPIGEFANYVIGEFLV